MSEQAVSLRETNDDVGCCDSTPAPVSASAPLTQRLLHLWRRLDKAWLAIGLIPVLLALIDPAQVLPTVRFAGEEILRTGVFIACAVLAVAFLRATGMEALLSKAFTGPEVRMIALGALVGGLAPFCSCEVIPFIAALLAVGAPLSAVMAFWLASPLMDPAMFLITSGTLGTGFAVAKTVAAVALGVGGGLLVKAMAGSRVFADPLKASSAADACATGCETGGGTGRLAGRPQWAFWRAPERRRAFRDTAVRNALFLGKWLLLAYLVEALMLRYVPAEVIATVLGGDGLWPILLGAVVGAPAYLNGYATVPLVDALLAQGMSNGAAMSFVIAGGVSCIPAAIAVWALVKTRVFASYLGIALVGSVVAGLIWNVVA
ncbi:MAG: permease [Spirochaetaceae bacterium]|nr:permease [Spirochaetaceae bacterium]